MTADALNTTETIETGKMKSPVELRRSLYTLEEPISGNLFQSFPLRVNWFQAHATVSRIFFLLPPLSLDST